MYSGPVLQAEVQPAAKIPPPALSTGGAGAEAHLSASRGEEGLKNDHLRLGDNVRAFNPSFPFSHSRYVTL